jgi:glucokinase
MGAALDGRNGMLWSSGPLWGPSTGPFDLAAALRQADDSFEWLVFNDITAALMWHVIRDDRSTTRTLLVTVSSGIGARLWDGVRRRIPLDPECGLQGEIGHLPISFMMDGKIIERDCDCGGKNHLNAFCSGSAIPSLLAAAVDRATPKLLSSSPLANEVNPGFTELAAAVKSEDEFALSLVSHLTRPLADLLLCQLTFDPEIERIIITGGVVHGLGHNYFESVLAHLDRIGLYEVSARAPAFFRERLELGLADDSAGLMGAAIMAASYSYGEQQI